MNKAVLFLAALGASTALCAPVPAEKAEKRDTIPIARVPDVPPPSRETLDASIRKAADFLLKEQNRDGSWGNHTRTKGLNVLCPYPEGPRSFRTASTSLCVIGLLTSPLKEDPAVKASLDKALQYLLTTLPTLKRGDTRTVLGVWGHAYGLSALSRAARNLPADAPLREELKKVASLQVNRHTGSLARTPAGDLALMRYDPSFISRSQLEDGLERIWSRGGWLSLAVKKPIPHESFAQNAGYFFYYGYYYAARCLEEVTPGHLARHAAHLASDLLPMQEEDGSWWDYPLYNYHKFYGTGYALYAVSRVRESLYPSDAATTS